MRNIWNIILGMSLLVGASHGQEQQQQVPLSKDLSTEYACIHPQYKVHLFSKSPLVMYLENFITAEEREHLRKLAYVYHPFGLHTRARMISESNCSHKKQGRPVQALGNTKRHQQGQTGAHTTDISVDGH